MRKNHVTLCAMLLTFSLSCSLAVADVGAAVQIVPGPNGSIAGVVVHPKRHRHHHRHHHKHRIAATLSSDVASVYQRIMYYRQKSQVQKSAGKQQAQDAIRARTQ